MNDKSKRFSWREHKDGSHIEDNLTKKRVSQKRKLVNFLNELWDTALEYEKENQTLKEELERLQRNKDELDMICKSYKDYYGEDISKAEWYGYIKRCYEKDANERFFL
jgi:predicted transcriptional regulator